MSGIIKLKTTSSGSVALAAENTSADVVVTVPAKAGTLMIDADLKTVGTESLLGSGDVSSPIFANVLFTETGRRIKGRFHDTTQANRTMFTNVTANNNCVVGAAPSGTAVIGGFRGYGNSDPNNSPYVDFYCNGSTIAAITAAKTGTASYLDLGLYVGNGQRMLIETDGTVTIPGKFHPVQLEFTEYGQRIKGRFHDTAQEDRTIFTNVTDNNVTVVGAAPSGTATIGGFRGYGSSDVANSPYVDFYCNGAVIAAITAGKTGTGAYLDLAFYTGGEQTAVLGTDGQLTLTSGGLSFSDTGARIKGRFHDTTQSNRTIFTNVTDNNNAVVGAAPSGTATIGGFRGYGASDPANSPYLDLYCNGSELLSAITAAKTGTGAFTDIGFYVGGSQRMLIGTDGAVSIPGALTVGSINGAVIGNTTPAAGSFTTLSASDNITMSGVGKRILGDFSNATASDRVIFKTSTVNGATRVGFMPDGTGTTSGLTLYGGSDLSNASQFQISLASTALNLIVSGAGTFTYVPLKLFVGGGERMSIATDGAVTIPGSLTTTGLVSSGNTVRFTNGTVAIDMVGTTTDGYVGTITNHPLHIRTNNTNRINIDAAGAVTIPGTLTVGGVAITGGSLTPVTVSGTTQTAASGNIYILTNVAATTVTLPASPASGDTVGICPDNGLTTNVIARNGQTIMKLSEDMTLDSSTATVTLRFLNNSWRTV